MLVQMIPPEWSHKMILRVHYARKVPSIMYAFGLFHNNEMIGVCTFGMPPNNMLNCKNLFDKKVDVDVIELNRLCVENGSPKNSSSILVSGSLNLLPKPICIVSYADINQGHIGYIYQATNWIYTGVSSKDTRIFNSLTGELSHRKTIFNIYGSTSNLPDHFSKVKEEHGKHRYFYFLGNKNQVRQMRLNLKYDTLPYPKGESRRYETQKQKKSGFFKV